MSMLLRCRKECPPLITLILKDKVIDTPEVKLLHILVLTTNQFRTYSGRIEIGSNYPANEFISVDVWTSIQGLGTGLPQLVRNTPVFDTYDSLLMSNLVVEKFQQLTLHL